MFWRIHRVFSERRREVRETNSELEVETKKRPEITVEMTVKKISNGYADCEVKLVTQMQRGGAEQ